MKETYYPILPPPPEILPPLHAHTRRVTCNLVRIASDAVCPPDLRELLERIAAGGWDFSGLTPVEDELLYAEMSWERAHSAQAEFSVDTTQRRIYRPPITTVCQLCGHDHNTIEFLGRNAAAGRELWIGSTCVVTWMTRIDGDLVGAKALERLKTVLNEIDEQIRREKWQEAHPEWEADRELLGKVTPGWWRMLPAVVTRDNRGREADQVLSYWRDKDFLTPKKTDEAYNGKTGLLAWVRDIDRRIAAAEQFDLKAYAVEVVEEVKQLGTQTPYALEQMVRRGDGLGGRKLTGDWGVRVWEVQWLLDAEALIGRDDLRRIVRPGV